MLCVQSAVCACSCYFQQCAVETEPTCQSSPCGTSIAHLAKVKYMFFENIYLFSMVLSNKKDKLVYKSHKLFVTFHSFQLL